jgi:hypothetical protein
VSELDETDLRTSIASTKAAAEFEPEDFASSRELPNAVQPSDSQSNPQTNPAVKQPSVEFTPPAVAAIESDVQDADLANATSNVVDEPSQGVNETVQFEQPVTRPEGVDASIERYFGTFHTGIVKDACAHREQIQDKLVELIVDQDADSEFRARAVFLLGAMGPAAKAAVPALRREMHYDTDEYFRVDLAEAILKIQAEDEDAIRVLVECLSESEDEVRWIAAHALRTAVSARTTFIIDPLMDSLKTDDLKLRRMIFLTLAEFGEAAAKAVPELEAALDSPDPATREIAKASLACIAPDRKTSQQKTQNSERNQYAVNR